jgi:aspartate/methionine/tyrosine aminotransferase
MINPALDRLPGSAFVRLRALLDPLVPAVGTTLAMSIGEPQLPPPPWVAEIVAANAHLWNRYPPNDGTPELRAACAAWLTRRFGLPAGCVDPARHVLSAAGSREALFLFALAAVPQEKHRRRPAVLMPNPYYQVYRAAAEMSGAEPVLVPASKESGYLPDYAALPEEILDRAALAIFCSPSNPEGAVADLPRLTGLVRLARRHDFVLACDECYSELYFGEAPPSALAAALAAGEGEGDPFADVVVFHSLSKRSSAPGLRSGFVAGDARILRAFLKLRSYAAVAMPLPIQAASAALWADDAHAAANRAHYARLVAAADRIFAGYPGYLRPQGGFFLWLDVGDGEAAAKRFWQEGGIRVVPGRYLTADDPRAPNGNAGHAFVRIALVHDEETVTRGLSVIRALLDGGPRR